ncbi:hypothetical protein ACFY5D_03595 [Paeniglutamicibacter sp. NPDC012692]|uniref:hypothetical protein n=1 Tax=Paeniglutamicibacter sp. NPDC012692 TaxID=3364388 RepID=UPI00367AAD40
MIQRTTNGEKSMNAARELAALMTEWNTETRQSLFVRRGMRDGESSLAYDFWQRQRKCIELIVETENALESLRERGIPVDNYRPMLARVWNYAFSPEVQWQTSNTNHLLGVEDIQSLETLSHFFDAFDASGPQISVEGRAALLELLDAVIQETQECFDIPQAIRVRLATHVQFLREALDPEIDIDPRKLQRLLDQMAGVLLSAMNETKSTEKRRKLFAYSVSLATAMAQSGAYDALKALAGTGVQELLGIEASE